MKNDIHQKSFPDNSSKNFCWIHTATMRGLIEPTCFVFWLSDAGKDSRPAKQENSTGTKHKSDQTRPKQHKKLIKHLPLTFKERNRYPLQQKRPENTFQIIQKLVKSVFPWFFSSLIIREVLK
ncbi:hypothetical protein [Winslowiella iniecta]|uniref:hypothetical protein n=1 Tax=Winslowiella iniecta TaxID=1560201 RepID=UPI0012E2D793|nr:hypothetical protein [Winslowiella iniecta]